MSEQHRFQAEIQQLLDIVIHSLYTDREVFVRELISNAADACERLRFTQAAGPAMHEPEVPPAISVSADETENTITFADTGLGMTRAELVENLGTIAHSGTRHFLQQLAAEQKPDAKLIGQFGVGFYSSFMVAQKVTVTTRSHLPEEAGWCWTSAGAAGYEIAPAPDAPRGTKIVLELKDDAKEFTKAAGLERIIKRYSNFVQFPIALNGQRLNTVQSIWSRNKSEIKEEEYQEFYQYIGHDAEPPLLRLHFTADAPLAIQALLFVPGRNWETLGLGRGELAVSLYCKKVLVRSSAKELFPGWLRFLRGVVDSEDLPLHVSRESTQDTALMEKLSRVLTGRFLKFLEEEAERDPAKFEKFHTQYERFLKEGIIADYSHREALARLLRFGSSAVEPGKLTSLADYLKRMPGDQTEIYYLSASARAVAEASPYYEVFRARKYEVLWLTDPWDEFVLEHVRSFGGKLLQAAERADLALGEAATRPEGLTSEAAEGLAKWLKETLGARIEAVRVSRRLLDSPALVVDHDRSVTAHMRRLLRAMPKEEAEEPEPRLDLEINPQHPIAIRLERVRQTDAALAATGAEQLLDNARMAAGLLEDPRSMLKRLNQLLEQALDRPA